MKYGFIFAGLVFLFNPYLNIIDFLPDCVGWLLIYAGIYKIADVVEKLADARRQIVKLILLTFVKMAAMLLIPITDDTFTLVLTFSFAVAELILLIPAGKSFFEGILYFGVRNGSKIPWRGEKALEKSAAKKKTSAAESCTVYEYADRSKYFTLAFFIFRMACAVLPELTSLSQYDSLGMVTSGVQLNIKQFTPAFVVIGAFFSLIFGIVWLARMIRLFWRIQKDEAFNAGWKSLYETNIRPNRALFVFREGRAFLLCAALAVISIFNFYVDQINVLPNILCAVLMMIAVLQVRKIVKNIVFPVILGIALAVCSVGSLLLEIGFSQKYTYEAVLRLYEAANTYRPLQYVGIAGAVIFFLLIFSVLALMNRLSVESAKLLYGDNAPKHMADFEWLHLRLNIATGLTLVQAVMMGAYSYLVLYVEAAWLISLFVSAVWILFMLKLLYDFYESVYGTYAYYL